MPFDAYEKEKYALAPFAVKLTRTIRIALAPTRGTPSVESWGSADAWSAALEIEACVQGTPDAVTGYIVGIDAIDARVRALAAQELLAGFLGGAHPGTCVARMRDALALALDLRVNWLTIRPHPFAELRVEESMPDSATLSHRFDFAASHRLHCPSLGDQANRRIFGKCNNPAGHGHNYRLETEVRVPLGNHPALRGSEIDRIVREHAIDRLDHRHLNTDVEAFKDLNPSVEHIARVCHAWLQAPLAAAGGELVRVRLWETEKTSAIYPG